LCGVAYDRVWLVRQAPTMMSIDYRVLARFCRPTSSTATVRNNDEKDDEAILRHYLSLNVDIDALYGEWSKDEYFARILASVDGRAVVNEFQWWKKSPGCLGEKLFLSGKVHCTKTFIYIRYPVHEHSNVVASTVRMLDEFHLLAKQQHSKNIRFSSDDSFHVIVFILFRNDRKTVH
jgi:hypothetical protein